MIVFSFQFSVLNLLFIVHYSLYSHMKHLIPFFILLISAASCTERINIHVDDAPPHIVIYGLITTDVKQHAIHITRSAGYFTTDSPEGISNAVVTISDDAGKVIPLIENDTIQGMYQTSADVCGEEGKTYTLDIYIDNDGNRPSTHYRSEAYLQHINHIDSVGLQASLLFRQSVEVLLYAQDIGGNNYYSIFVAINDSVVNSRITRFMVMDNALFRGQYMNGIACYYLSQNPDSEYRNEILHIGDTVTLNINAISQEYATFISNAQSEIRGSNPIFGGPPANVPSNIRCISPPNGTPALGFFTAYPSRYAQTIVTKEFK